ncbi:tetratricopeptide repeat protein [Fibrella aquatilis]|uniref:Tetratricopeptide repeat protein n=1 Tax=Fibrella aquatilis TaxID=2817059 RepID=A0A939K2T6_9BACT|nr:tetratricopeptide repeat protein [Fibrella aquatilis]MBO0934421.1 tetratricopeptide repeat protein [Fibrella aquatilis]
MKHIYSFLVAILLCCGTAYAQQWELDSLLIALGKHPQDDTVKLALLIDIAFDYSGIDPGKGVTMADRAILLAKKLNDKTKLATAYLQKGLNYSSKGEDSLALILDKEALTIYRQMGSRQNIAASLHNIGILYFNKSNYLEAINYHQQAADIFRQVNDQNRLSSALNSLAVNYMYTTQYPKALESYLAVLTIREQIGDREGTATALGNIGLLYKRMANYAKALDYHTKALKLLEQGDNRSHLANVLGNIATVYDFQEKPDKALTYYARALAINQSIGNKRGIASNLVNIGIVHHDQGRYAQALPYLQQGLPLFRQLGDRTNESIVLDYLGDWYAKAPDNLLRQQGISPAQRYEQVVAYQRRELQLAREIGALDLQADAWERISQTYKMNKQYARALMAYQRSVTLRDSVMNDEKRAEITRQEVRHTFEKKQAVLNAQHTAEIKQQQTQRNAALGGGALVLLAGAGGFLSFKRRREAEQQRNEAELKAEIASTEMKALRAQMNPHFIFNSLNSISDFIGRNDTKTADYYLAKFAKLMRLILENSEKREIPLADDLLALNLYMQLEAMRLRDGFTYQILVDDDIDPADTLVPPLLLQPFVENSIWHGLAHKPEQGHILVHICKEGDMLTCIVEDNGVGRHRTAENAAGQPDTKSLGMTITNARIAMLNQRKQANAAVVLSDLPAGTRVAVKLPLELSF